MKIFITGADGMLGSHLVRELLKHAYTVTVCLQRGRKTRTLENLPLEILEGDILSADDIQRAIKEAEVVIHMAANTNIWPSRSEIVREVNIKGTFNVIEACLFHKIKRLIYVGTANSFGFGSKENPGNEKNPYKSSKYGLDYMDSKYEAQQLILKYVKEKQLPAVIVNPTFMLGAYDSKPGSGAMILAVYNRKVPGFSPGGRNYVYVNDVAVAIVNAIEKGNTGECYIAGNRNMDYREAFSLIAEVVGVKPPKIRFPAIVTKIYGALGNVFAGITGSTPTVSLNMAKIACDGHYYSANKAIKELDMPQTPVEFAIKEAFDWFVTNGYIKK